MNKIASKDLDSLRQHVINLLTKAEAHVDLRSQLEEFPRELRGRLTRADGKSVPAPYTAWQLLEHIRIAQWDILQFCVDPNHVSPKWPEGYWPPVGETQPADPPMSRAAATKTSASKTGKTADKTGTGETAKNKNNISKDAWQQSVRQVVADLDAVCELVRDPKRDLFARIPHGKGQTLLREALLVADHNAYHLGQLVMLRKMLEGS